MTSGLRRSLAVIDRMTASWRLSWPSSILAFDIAALACMAPGSMPIKPCSPPILRSWRSWLSRSSMSNWPLRTLAASFSASSLSIVSAARSTSDTISPMPRMRLAMRSGWNGSRASNFSPTPISLTGLPVTARMESAAPPRESPSTRDSTMPVTPTFSLKARATLTASWPVMASATSSVDLGGLGEVADIGDLLHQLLVDREPAARYRGSGRRSPRVAPSRARAA